MKTNKIAQEKDIQVTINAFKRLKSVWKAIEELQEVEQSIRLEQLDRLGVDHEELMARFNRANNEGRI
jgi:hypothetical protein